MATPLPALTPMDNQVLDTLVPHFGSVKFSLSTAKVPGMTPTSLEMVMQGLEAAGYAKQSEGMWWFTQDAHTRIASRTAAVVYLPNEDDVDPEVLADGKGKIDPQAHDQRDTNFSDRMHTSALRSEDGLVVIHKGRKVASWDPTALDEALDNGTLDPRRVEASAIEYYRRAVGHRN